MGFAEEDLKKYRRAKDRATKLGWYEYIPRIDRIIEALEAIVTLDEEAVGEKNE